jgi:branched-chain amino acid aminotransferase
MDINVILVKEHLKRLKPADESTLGWGKYFSNHMFLMDYKQDKGWHNSRIIPYGLIPLEPSAAVLHYAQQAYEGLKAYRGPRGEVYLFRPDQNLKRLSRSCDRMCIPAYPEDVILEAIKKLISIDADWVPSAPVTALYIRPVIIASETFIGVRPSNEYLFYIITSPVGAYYPEGFAPVSIFVEDNYIRAASGGVGEAKTSANYAPALKAQVEAQKKGFSQVLWLDAKHLRFVEEVGTMNIAFKFKNEVATAPLSGTILPGVTRSSALTLCREFGLKVSERSIAIDEIISKLKTGELEEVFGMGTAAVIAPVSSLHYKGQTYAIGSGQSGSLATKLFDSLISIQYGLADDSHGWRIRVI